MAFTNNSISKKTALTILKALISPSDIKHFDYLQAIMLCGMPGSGKSTIAKLISTCYGFEPISTDLIRINKFDGQHRSGSDAQASIDRFLVYEELGTLAVRLLAQGKKIVIDGTNLQRKRFSVLGNILTQIPIDRVAIIIVRPPQWIMNKRFKNSSVSEFKNWKHLFDIWKDRLRQGDAVFPTEKNTPQIRLISIRRYAIKTFDWVPDIKAIFWDFDGTLYRYHPRLLTLFDKKCIDLIVEQTKLPRPKATAEFWSRYANLKSKTKTIASFGLDGRKFISKISSEIPYEKYLKPDPKLVSTIKSLNHIKHFILTNTGQKEISIKLKALNLDPAIFDGIMAVHDFPYLKPDVRVFKLALKKTGFKPFQTLAVGDREDVDIIPAKEAKLKTCYTWGVSKEADVSLPNVYQVAELFGKEI